MTTQNFFTLAELGWRNAFQQQLTFDMLEAGFVGRVINVQRDRLTLLTVQGEQGLLLAQTEHAYDPEYRATVGDWLWVHGEPMQAKTLERNTHLKRVAAGSNPKPQSIAANIDTLFIVSSCNADFNASRIERYLTLVMSAHIPAVIVLTKADLSEQPDTYLDSARAIHPDVLVLMVNALDGTAVSAFAPWNTKGQTLAFIGSSGVGKSTLSNLLLGQQVQGTQGIREDDAKGRHTTTDRSLHRTLAGAWVLDTPGMRELRLPDVSEGVSEVFGDIETLEQQCKFSNCHHENDAGCAIQAALSTGQLDARRWRSYLKLKREADFAQSQYWQQREKGRAFGKMTKRAQKEARLSKGQVR